MLKFGTDGLRGIVGESPLVAGEMARVGYAMGQYFRSAGGSNVVIGRDTRESGGWITGELTRGMICAGCTVYDAGIVTTPMLAYAVKTDHGLSGGLMVTASHNKYQYNGVKMFDGNGEKLTPDDERMVEALCEDYMRKDLPALEPEAGHLVSFDAMTPYIAGLSRYIGSGKFSGYRVLVDSASGAAYGLAKQVFESFGVECHETGASPDGKNINVSGALYSGMLTAHPLYPKIDLGVALDGDADRVVLVGPNGWVWDGDRLVAMLATWLPMLNRSVEKVVMTQYGNGGAMDYLRKNDVAVETVLVGDREVNAKCREIGAELGGETAGHVIVPSWLSSSDGVFVALLVLSVMKKTMRRLPELWPEYADYPSMQWTVSDPKKTALEHIAGWAEALAVAERSLENGRILVRRSGTETDKIRVLVESKYQTQCLQAGEQLVGWLESALAQK